MGYPTEGKENNKLSSFFKSLQGKQASLLTRLDELDQECVGLREELEQVEGSRQKLQEEVRDMQTHCDELQQQLHVEEVKITHS